MSIMEMRELIEEHKKHIVLGVLFVLVSSISFALGYLSAGEVSRPQIVITQGSASSTPPILSKAKVPAKKAVPKVPAPKEVIPSPVTIVYEPEPSTTHASPVASQGEPPLVTVNPTTTVAPALAPSTNPVVISSVQITEVTAGTELSSDDEYIELYNPNSVAIDISSYSIKKRTASGNESSLVSASRLIGKSIPAGRHFLIAHDSGYRGSVVSDATWAKSNDLAYANNTVILYNGSGVKITEVSWTKLEPGQSTTGVATPQNSSQ